MKRIIFIMLFIMSCSCLFAQNFFDNFHYIGTNPNQCSPFKDDTQSFLPSVWRVSHGSPKLSDSFNQNFFDYVKLECEIGIQGPVGEGLFANYDFKSNATYDIHFVVKHISGVSSDIEIYASSSIVPNPSSNCGLSLSPSTAGADLITREVVNTGLLAQGFSVQGWSPSTTRNTLWIRSSSIFNPLSSFGIGEIRIIEHIGSGSGSGGSSTDCYSRLDIDGFYINKSLDLVKDVCSQEIEIAPIPNPNPSCSLRFNTKNSNLFIALTLCDNDLNPIDVEYAKWTQINYIMPITNGWSFDLTNYLPSPYIHLAPGQVYRLKIATDGAGWQEFTKYIRIYDNNDRQIDGRNINSSVHGGNTIHIQNSTVKPTPVTQATFVHNIEMVANQEIVIEPNSTLHLGTKYRIGNTACNSLRVLETGNNNYSNYIQSDENQKESTGNTLLLGQKDSFSNQAIKIYPNPSNGQFKIDLTNNDQNALIEIYNILGKKVLTQKSSSTNEVINLKDQPSGTYLVRLTIGNKVFNEKIIYR